MLISFTVKNWMSFREETAFSMVASKERQHGERLPKVKKYGLRVLPVASIYGGNASGKTNLFKALSFAKHLIIRGTSLEGAIAVDCFKLDKKCQNDATEFKFEILVNELIYEYAFSVDSDSVHEEKLVLISSTSEKVLFHRTDGAVTLDSSLRKNPRLMFAFEGTRDNQLFLTNSVYQKLDDFRPVYNWFKETLELVAPDSRFEPFEQFFQEGHPLHSKMNVTLTQLDTGIDQLQGEEIPFDNLSLPDNLRQKLKEEVKENKALRLVAGPVNERVIIFKKDGELKAQKLITYHKDAEGNPVKVEMSQESDGSQRVIDLLPAFLEISAAQAKKVFVIDEVDRSLHSLLTRQLLEQYLSSCSSESRSQLLFTTHDVLLMDQDILRRDEMWVVERGQSGTTSMYSFSDFKDVRYDKDIRKSYLQGRLGGIPRIVLNQSPVLENA